jgi:hypothetical protein
MKRIALYLWSLPQNLLGLLLRLIYKGNDSQYEDAIVRRSVKMHGGISLGKYIIINQWSTQKTVQHEYGHCIQSKRLGWLYLIVVGLPSIIWAGLYGWLIPRSYNGYYRFYTEKWADRLGGVER